MVILGINAYHGDASAAVVVDGTLIAAVEEERFNRIKHAAGFPTRAIRYCLEQAGVGPSEIDYVAVPRDPRARLFRKALHAARAPRHALERLKVLRRFGSIHEDLAAALDVPTADLRARFVRVEHHRAHLASSFFVSPFEEAALLSIDGLGDFSSTLWGVGRGNRIQTQGSIAFPHSLGIYYTALTQYLGFWKYGDEYKVMGLASYGEPDRAQSFERIVRANGGAGFRLGLEYFIHHRQGAEMSWREGTPVLGRLFSAELERELGPARAPGAALEARHHAIAASLQLRLEDVVIAMVRHVQRATGLDRLCLAGGVAFNCVANGRILRETPVREIFVQPAAGDAGLSIGAAYHVHHEVLGKPRDFVMRHAYWGPEYSAHQIRSALAALRTPLEAAGACTRRIEREEELTRWTAERLADGKVVGWFQGRLEWGPRALGNRSILVDPRRAEMKDVLNARIKHREPFRPFAPSILADETAAYFEQSHPSPFMQMTYRVRPEKREDIAAATHVDGTGRLQTVEREANPRYWMLLQSFKQLTGVPVLVNTSFNDNEPIVCTPEEAIDCFLRTNMDALVLGETVMEKHASGD